MLYITTVTETVKGQDQEDFDQICLQKFGIFYDADTYAEMSSCLADSNINIFAKFLIAGQREVYIPFLHFNTTCAYNLHESVKPVGPLFSKNNPDNLSKPSKKSGFLN